MNIQLSLDAIIIIVDNVTKVNERQIELRTLINKLHEKKLDCLNLNQPFVKVSFTVDSIDFEPSGRHCSLRLTYTAIKCNSILLDLFARECTVRPVCRYMQSDQTLYSPYGQSFVSVN